LDRGWGRPEQSISTSVAVESYADVLARIEEEEDAVASDRASFSLELRKFG
jgi:hypothetical protein